MKKHVTLDKTHGVLSITVKAPCRFFQANSIRIVHFHDDIEDMFQAIYIIKGCVLTDDLHHFLSFNIAK